MQINNKIWLLILLLPLQGTGQITVNGRVTDAGNGQPVPYATVYINGTTNGTISDTTGRFSLEKVHPPCEMVISHVSYATQAFKLKHQRDTTLQVKLKPRDLILDEVEVSNKNLREENFRHFMERFLGDDYWGKNAFIKNENVLVFQRMEVEPSDTLNENFVRTPDSTSVLFRVYTKAPLLVDLPLLGYNLYINLIEYTELYSTAHPKSFELHLLGYFYFQENEVTSKRKTNRFRKKRLEAWYNSDRHFCRSLFYDELKEQGYLVIYSGLNPKTEKYESFEIEFDRNIITDNQAKIIGLKNKHFTIEYFSKFNYPVNLKLKETDEVQRPFSANIEYSRMYFLKDTCTIRADGSRPDNSIMFGPVIGDKHVGAMLPNEYRPGK